MTKTILFWGIEVLALGVVSLSGDIERKVEPLIEGTEYLRSSSPVIDAVVRASE